MWEDATSWTIFFYDTGDRFCIAVNILLYFISYGYSKSTVKFCSFLNFHSQFKGEIVDF